MVLLCEERGGDQAIDFAVQTREGRRGEDGDEGMHRGDSSKGDVRGREI